MNIGLYQSAASLSALERWQDVTTQNITASQLTGYRKRTIEMQGVALGELNGDPRKTKIGAGEGPQSIFPTTKFGISFQHGETFPTRRPLDVALQGDGFFAIELKNDGGRAFTRVGEFQVSPQRTLITRDGHQVLNRDGAPIQLLPNGDPLGIAEDGTISQGTAQIGKLGVQRFSDTSVLTPAAGGLFLAPEEIDPVAVENPIVLQGHLEGSNVTPMREMISLVQIARAYEANQKIITTQDQTLAKALETLG
jgi:flagellar basal body rod protein FlgG